MYAGGTNSVVSEILASLSTCSPIPPILSVQLDNCASNKSYVTLGAFAWFLMVQNAVREVYLCFNEVGHTHIDIDAVFGKFSQTLSKNECPTPDSLISLFKTELGVRDASYFLSIYDFQSLFDPIVNKFKILKANHMFRIYLSKDRIPKVQIAPYIRSVKWLKAVGEPENFERDVFKTLPDPDVMPEIIPPNFEQLQKLLHAANKAKELLQPDEMRSYFQCINAIKTYKPESFRQLITKINKNAYTPVASCSLGDPDNIAIQKFMKQNKEIVEKIWNKIQAEERQLNTEENENVASSIITINDPESEVVIQETHLIPDVARSADLTEEPTSVDLVAAGGILIDDAAENDNHGIISVEVLEQPSTSRTRKPRKRKVLSENPLTTERPKRTCTIRK